MENVTQRPAEPGELCTCGRPAITIYLGTVFGDSGDCGIRDGGSRQGPCPFCGDPRSVREAHGGRCPDYRLRPDRGSAGSGAAAPAGQPMLFASNDPRRFAR
jgi:hypothetical protein